MTSTEPVPDANAVQRLRKADVWTGLVLAVVAIAMVAGALTFPLAGTYAGVRNVWYVSPALFPLIVGGLMLALSLGLVTRALREYRAIAPGCRVFRIEAGAIGREGANALLIAALLTFYIVGLVPRVDFVVATTLLLIVFIGTYVIASTVGRGVLVACLGGAGVMAFAVALAGAWPAPRSSAQHIADGVVAVVVLLSALGLAVFARGKERRRLVPVIGTSIGTAVVLSAVFKYGLLVPLPREGLGVALMDGVARALFDLLR